MKKPFIARQTCVGSSHFDSTQQASPRPRPGARPAAQICATNRSIVQVGCALAALLSIASCSPPLAHPSDPPTALPAHWPQTSTPATKPPSAQDLPQASPPRAAASGAAPAAVPPHPGDYGPADAGTDPSAAAWRAQLDALPALDWPATFTDPALRELIAAALRHNRDLRVALANVAQASALADLRAAERRPSLGLSLSGARTPKTDGGIASSYQAGVGVSAYELDLWGRLQAIDIQARAQALSSSQAAQAARLSLIASVAQTWAALLADEQGLRLARQTLIGREDSLRLVQAKLQAGAASALDLQSAQSAVHTLRAGLPALQRSRNANLLNLQQLCGCTLGPAQHIALQREGLAGLHVADLPAGLPADLLERRPDLRQAQAQLAAADANIDAARAAYFPRISLTAAVGSASSALADLLAGGSWGWTLAPSAVLPLLDGGRNAANLAGARAARAAALAQYDRAIQTAFREVAEGLWAGPELAAQVQAQTDLLATETRRQQLMQMRHEHGAASQLEWLDVQRSMLAAQQALLGAKLAQVNQRIALFKALGGPPAKP